MVYSKEDFKRLWEANDYGSGIDYDDIADCAKAWGISSNPRIRPIDSITYRVLKAAQVNDAEEYNPNPTSQCEERIMIDLNDACGWLERNLPQCIEIENNYVVVKYSFIDDFKQAMKGGDV